MTTDKVTNLNYLTELADGNEDFIKEMIGVFLEENPKEVKELSQAIDETNFDLIKSVSHHMKSTVPFVGLDLLISKDLIDIEKLAMEKADIEAIKTHFSKVKTVCDKAFEELNQ